MGAPQFDPAIDSSVELPFEPSSAFRASPLQDDSPFADARGKTASASLSLAEVQVFGLSGCVFDCEYNVLSQELYRGLKLFRFGGVIRVEHPPDDGLSYAKLTGEFGIV